MRVFQCAVMGSGGVGKSAITVRFINGSYLEWYDPTIEDSYRKQFVVDGQPCLLEILDTAGIDQYLGLNDLFVRESEGFVLVFSLTQKDSLEEIKRVYDTIHRIKVPDPGERIPIMVVGNKSDLEHEREVDSATVEKLAAGWGCKYFETSARRDSGITLVFQELVRELRMTESKKRPVMAGRRRRRKCVVL